MILQFFVCQKEKFQDPAVTVLCFFLQMAKSNSRPMGEMALQNLKDEDLARQANDAS